MIGAAIAGAVVVGTTVLSMLSFTPHEKPNDLADRLPLALISGQATASDEGDTVRRGGRQVFTADHYESAHERMMQALAATEDPAIAVLPGDLTLASLDKSTRPARASVLGDERAVAILKEALVDAADQRTARLALASELSKQNLKLSHEAQMMAEAGSDARAASSTSAMLAYAPSSGAADVMSDAIDPFGQLLGSEEQAEDDLIGDVPTPLAKPKIAAPAPAIVPNTSRPTRTALAKPDSPIVEENEKSTGGWSLFGRKAKLPSRGSKIAVYDIAAGIVYMPNGEKLPASSGRGQYRDNPKYVHVKNRGATPPNVYKLRMRESRFHGVEAIRMLPVGTSKMYGRDGFLTHSYLLRVPGDSSGCVVFPNYNKFLNAFKRGEVATLVVVPRMAELPRYMAML